MPRRLTAFPPAENRPLSLRSPSLVAARPRSRTSPDRSAPRDRAAPLVRPALCFLPSFWKKEPKRARSRGLRARHAQRHADRLVRATGGAPGRGSALFPAIDSRRCVVAHTRGWPASRLNLSNARFVLRAHAAPMSCYRREQLWYALSIRSLRNHSSKMIIRAMRIDAAHCLSAASVTQFARLQTSRAFQASRAARLYPAGAFLALYIAILREELSWSV